MMDFCNQFINLSWHKIRISRLQDSEKNQEFFPFLVRSSSLPSPHFSTHATAMSFTARTAFPLPSVTRSYFLGHHSQALKSIQSLLTHIDLVLECRDFRVPLSSFNPLLETALRGKPRAVLLTKTDLCAPKDEQRVVNAVKGLGLMGGAGGGDVITTKKPDARTAARVLKFATSVAKEVDSMVGARMLVVGMPNVGKSTLLNALRRAGVNKGKSERTGAQPGITRKIGTSVKIHNDPDIYIIDTPGTLIHDSFQDISN